MFIKIIQSILHIIRFSTKGSHSSHLKDELSTSGKIP